MSKKEKFIGILFGITSALFVSIFTTNAGLFFIPTFYAASFLLANVENITMKEVVVMILYCVFPSFFTAIVIWIST